LWIYFIELVVERREEKDIFPLNSTGELSVLSYTGHNFS
jgi:hypothetical protein